jgi:phosphoribosylformylglycinamidine cyclo-ligase
VFENLPRVLPDGLGATIHRGTWPEHPIFGLVQEASGASDDDMFATFNMGVGMLLLVAPEAVEEVVARSGHEAFRIGEVARISGVHLV